MAKNNESKIKSLIKKLEKKGFTLSDVTDKSINQLMNNNAFKNFEKLVKRKLERQKIIEENKKYDEKFAKKREIANEKIFKQYPWVRKVMKFDNKFKNIKDAKTVLTRKLNEEKYEIEKVLNKYFDKKNKKYKKLIKEINKVDDIDALRSFGESVEYILKAYGSEEEGVFSFEISDTELIERIQTHFKIELLK